MKLLEQRATWREPLNPDQCYVQGICNFTSFQDINEIQKQNQTSQELPHLQAHNYSDT